MEIEDFKHYQMGWIDENGKFYGLTRRDTNGIAYIDDFMQEVKELIDGKDAKISEITHKYAKVRKPKMFNQDQILEIKQLRSQGKSLRKIAEKMGCCEATVRNYLKMEALKS